MTLIVSPPPNITQKRLGDLPNFTSPPKFFLQQIEEAAQNFPENSGHLSMYNSIFRLLKINFDERRTSIELPSSQQLGHAFQGTGIYIGPENKPMTLGFGPHHLSGVLKLRDELLKITQTLFPQATGLNILGPEYQTSQSIQPAVLDAKNGIYHGLDSNWPEELINQKISWGICLSLWDDCYYIPRDLPYNVIQQRYSDTANHIYQNMADEACLVVSALMPYSIEFRNFKEGFESAGWNIHYLNPRSNDPILLTKGF